MAPRSIWNGTVQFGLVGIPVGATTAQAEQSVKFTQGFVTEDSVHPVGRKEYDKVTDEILTRSDISRIYTFPDGRQVVITDDELASVSAASTKVMEVVKTVPLSEIPLHLASKSEFLFPREGGEQAYDLFVSVMEADSVAAIAQTVRRGKAHIVALHAEKGVLVATYLVYADEVKKVDVAPAEKSDQTAAMTALVHQVLEALKGEFQHADYADAAREELLALIEAKASGADFPVAERSAPSAVSLMDALAASIAKAASNPEGGE